MLRTKQDIEKLLIDWGFERHLIDDRDLGDKLPTVRITVWSIKGLKDGLKEYLVNFKPIVMRVILIRKTPILGVEVERYVL